MRFDWIPELREDDLRGMVRILDAVALTTGTNGFAEPLGAKQVEELAAKINYGLRAGTLHQLMVREGTEVAGIVTLECCSQPTRRHIVEVRRAAVAPDRRGAFLLRAWAEVLRHCRAKGWEILQIDVSEDGPVALWEHLGFRTFGTVADYARVGARKLDGYYMTCTVPDRAERSRPNRRGKESHVPAKIGS